MSLSKKLIVMGFAVVAMFGGMAASEELSKDRVKDSYSRKVLKGHTSDVNSVAYSPDGKTLLTGSYDDTASVWEVLTGKQLQLLKGHTGRVESVAYSPDGKTVLTGSYDKTACVWSVSTGELLKVLKGHTGSILAVAYSPDGKTVLTGSWGVTACVWDVKTGELLKVLEGHGNRVYSVAYSPDGKTVLTGSRDHTACVWSVKTGKQLQLLKGHTGLISSVAYSPDGKTILTGSLDTTACLWSFGEEFWDARQQTKGEIALWIDTVNRAQRRSSLHWIDQISLESLLVHNTTALPSWNQELPTHVCVSHHQREIENYRRSVHRLRREISELKEKGTVSGDITSSLRECETLLTALETKIKDRRGVLNDYGGDEKEAQQKL